jgi:hypothetical protein
MRIEIVRRLSPLQRVCLAMWKAIIGDVAGPMLVVSYRKLYFGNKGEIELFAAFTSSVNSCNY